MVRLTRVVPPGCADIFVKLEWENPTGSIKDRMAEAVISRADSREKLDHRVRAPAYPTGRDPPERLRRSLRSCCTPRVG